MAHAQSKAKPTRKAAPEATLARTLAPEEIRPGDFVATLYEIVEFPPWMWCTDPTLTRRDETVRIRTTPREDSLPLKVRSVCLPFVLVREPCGRDRTLDVRRCRLARLDGEYSAAAWKAYRKAAKKRRCGKKGEGDEIA